MNHNEPSLLGFLQSRSLFSHQNNLPHSRTKSLRSRDSPRAASPNVNINTGVNQEQQTNYTKNWTNSLQNSLKRNNEGFSNTRISNRTEWRPQQNKWVNRGWSRLQATTPSQPANRYQPQPQGPAFLYKSKPNTFETAHMQSFRCLDNVSNKLSIRLTEMNENIDRFTHRVKAWITQELHFAYQSVTAILDNTFRQQEILIRAYVQKVQQSYTSQIMKAKAILEAEYRKVDELKQHLKGPEWRKATGQILTSQLQAKIDSFIAQTYSEQSPEWIPRSYVREHLKTIEMQIYEMLKIKTFAIV